MLRNEKILVIDDDETLCYLLKEELINEGFIVDILYEADKVKTKLKEKNYDIILLDLNISGHRGEEILKFAKEEYPSVVVIILTGETEIRSAINCIKLGAYDFINKPYNFEQLLVTIERAIDHKQLVLNNKLLLSKITQNLPTKIIGNSKEIKEVLKLAEKAAQADSNILLESETGTGKELFAEYIHQCSDRANNPFVAINCASLPDQLIESELFGYEKGAFTDARTTKQGLVEIADGGTLFLDEIGEMSLALQPKLLRFLENGEYRRVGGVDTRKSNVRVIGATNKNLLQEAENKNFRKDLLFRLNVITLRIPPLRNRGKDIILLANYFIKQKSSLRAPKKLSGEAERALMNYHFPGNVRELQHIIERAMIFSETNEITAADLNLPGNNNGNHTFVDIPDDIVKLEDVEKIHIRKILDKYDWNRENTARALGISQKTLYTKIKKYNLK